MILDNQWGTIDEVVHHLCTSHGTAHGIIQDRLGFHKVCATWVPKHLTGEHKHKCLTICQGLLNHHCKKDDFFLDALSLGPRRGSTI
jgi:hypothetical protein